MTYTVTCSKGVVGVDTVDIIYTVPTATISAASTNIVQGQANSLTWTSANAEACTASSNGSGGWTGARATNGNASVTEQTLGMITYTITCTSASQSGQASVNVFVNAPPAPPAPPPSGGGGGSFEVLTLFGLLSTLWLHLRKVPSAVRYYGSTPSRRSSPISPPGRMVVIMDDEDRENEGDLIMAAQKVRPEDINFMARSGAA